MDDQVPRPEFWGWFQSVADAEQADTGASDLRLITVALSRDDAAELVELMGGAEQPWLALLRREVPADGAVLGFEILGAEEALVCHSWHCFGYADQLLEEQGIGVDDLGLFRTEADARAALEWMSMSLRPSAEAPAPVPWFVAALVETAAAESTD